MVQTGSWTASVHKIMSDFIFATRPSDLAIWQTEWVIKALQSAWPERTFAKKVITTRGDKVIDKPLPEIGGKGLFTYELEQALLSKQVDGAVHSLKDLPVENPQGLVVGGIPQRADVRDVLVSEGGLTLDELPRNARVGTSSLRRTAQLKAYRPDLEIVPLRGNVDTRVEKTYREEYDYDAIVLAAAGILRSGLEKHISQYLPLEVMLPAPAQGALGIQTRTEGEVLSLLLPIEDHNARRATQAERAFLYSLGGGCTLPVGAYGVVDERTDEIQLEGVVAAVDGTSVIRIQGRGMDPDRVGKETAHRAIDQGAKELLDV